ncbi:hypothetical protein H1S01_13395 [Heliobacterium chlorum]|uniref:Uncharacterized protein n=1 Tax=Heliobacterium chlorum TaxID=2698 RepID=A0ABR7T5Y7_HELCL|nr:hypothetical protein [Heliobacterium chlorum]MBC9785497.1 hypothetical protein [Heliobacterium chlorum]
MEGFIQEADIVYRVLREDEKIQLKTFHCAVISLKIVGEESPLTVNTGRSLLVKYEDWQGKLLPNINTSVTLAVAHGGDQTVTLPLTPVNGIGEFDFISEKPGIYFIKAVAEGFAHNPAEFRVEVTE